MFIHNKNVLVDQSISLREIIGPEKKSWLLRRYIYQVSYYTLWNLSHFMSLYGNRQEGSVTWDHVYNNEITSYSEENFIRYPSRQQTKLWLSLRKSRPKEKNVLARWKNYLTSDQRNLQLNSVILLPSDIDFYVTLSK